MNKMRLNQADRGTDGLRRLMAREYAGMVDRLPESTQTKFGGLIREGRSMRTLLNDPMIRGAVEAIAEKRLISAFCSYSRARGTKRRNEATDELQGPALRRLESAIEELRISLRLIRNSFYPRKYARFLERSNIQDYTLFSQVMWVMAKRREIHQSQLMPVSTATLMAREMIMRVLQEVWEKKRNGSHASTTPEFRSFVADKVCEKILEMQRNDGITPTRETITLANEFSIRLAGEMCEGDRVFLENHLSAMPSGLLDGLGIYQPRNILQSLGIYLCVREEGYEFIRIGSSLQAGPIRVHLIDRAILLEEGHIIGVASSDYSIGLRRWGCLQHELQHVMDTAMGIKNGNTEDNEYRAELAMIAFCEDSEAAFDSMQQSIKRKLDFPGHSAHQSARRRIVHELEGCLPEFIAAVAQGHLSEAYRKLALPYSMILAPFERIIAQTGNAIDGTTLNDLNEEHHTHSFKYM